MSKVVVKYDLIIKRKAFLHWYTGEGMTLTEFSTARYGVNQLMAALADTSLPPLPPWEAQET